MNNLKKIAPLPVLALLVLAACTNPLAKEASQQVMEKSATGSEVTTEASGSRFEAGLKCSKLKVAMNRDSCEQQVNNLIGSMMESEILESFDMKRCKDLPSDLSGRCEEQLADSGIQGPVSADEMAIFAEAVAGTFPEPDESGIVPAPTYDKAACGQLTTPGYKEYCEDVVTRRMERDQLDQIYQTGSVNDCDTLTSEDAVFDCKLFFGVELEVLAPVAPPVPAPPEESPEVAQ